MRKSVMRQRIHINDHETLSSLACKYPGRSIRWLRDAPHTAANVFMGKKSRRPLAGEFEWRGQA